jgi:hypothetical protein
MLGVNPLANDFPRVHNSFSFPQLPLAHISTNRYESAVGRILSLTAEKAPSRHFGE